MKLAILLSACLFAVPTQSADDGLALTPPMGWRSWNCFGADVDQGKMQGIMERMTERTRLVDGVPTSFADLGYSDCGLDDNWQACGTGIRGSFHDQQGNPLINYKLFPNMSGMTAFGHARGLKVGWYMNNCICSETQFKDPDEIKAIMQRSARMVAELGYDALKLDGCSQFRNLTWWYELLNATGRPIVVENCHWGETVPGDRTGDAPCSGTTPISDCPYHFFRTSGDITNTWSSMFGNLQTTRKFQGDIPLSRPGTWAYPDMMEVGRMATYEQDRTHFGAWVITSSPLILGYDLNNQQITDIIWDFISNKEAIAINQAWAGHPGRLVASWRPGNVTSRRYVQALRCGEGEQKGWSYDANSQAIRFNGQCMDATDGAEMRVVPCNGSPAQRWGRNGKALTNGIVCLDVYNHGGPVVQLYSCNGGANQKFDFNGDGTLTDDENPRHCLTVTDDSPAGSEGFQIWTKVLPKGEVAALVLSAEPIGAYSVKIDFQQHLRLPAGQRYVVRDVWSQLDVGVFSGSYTTPRVIPYDSQLLVFRPADSDEQ